MAADGQFVLFSKDCWAASGVAVFNSASVLATQTKKIRPEMLPVGRLIVACLRLPMSIPKPLLSCLNFTLAVEKYQPASPK